MWALLKVYTHLMRKYVLAVLAALGGLILSRSAYLSSLTSALPPLPFPIWRSETIATDGELNDIELDGVDDPYVVFVDSTRDVLRYAKRVQGEWVASDIVSFLPAVPPADLAFDMAIRPLDGVPYVAYVNTDKNELDYGRLESGQWQWETVGVGGRLLSLRFDAAGIAHIILVEEQSITYYRQSGASWNMETVGEPDAYVWNLFLDMDAIGQPHIAWTGANGSFHAYRSVSSGWVIEPHWPENIEGFVLDAGGRPNYLITMAEPLWFRPPYSRITLSLINPTDDPQVWNEIILWVADEWYVNCDMAAGSNGEFHVVFRETNGRPHYVVVDSQSHVTREHPAAGGVGPISLALDSSGNPQLTHYDGENLIYSFRDTILLTESVYLPVTSR